jgi:hypothetical protein
VCCYVGGVDGEDWSLVLSRSRKERTTESPRSGFEIGDGY